MAIVPPNASYWPLDEASGVIARDVVNGIDATLVGFTDPDDWVDGVTKGGLQFHPSTDERLQIIRDDFGAVFSPIGSWSFSCKIQNNITPSDSESQRLFSIKSGGAIEALEIVLLGRFAIRAEWFDQRVDAAGGYNVKEGPPWTITTTFDNTTNQVIFYRDGVEWDSGTIPGATGQTLPVAGPTVPIMIGNYAHSPSATPSWRGIMDEVRFENRTWTPEEVLAIHEDDGYVRNDFVDNPYIYGDDYLYYDATQDIQSCTGTNIGEQNLNNMSFNFGNTPETAQIDDQVKVDIADITGLYQDRFEGYLE